MCYEKLNDKGLYEKTWEIIDEEVKIQRNRYMLISVKGTTILTQLFGHHEEAHDAMKKELEEATDDEFVASEHPEKEFLSEDAEYSYHEWGGYSFIGGLSYIWQIVDMFKL
jgi:hypothetical protein